MLDYIQEMLQFFEQIKRLDLVVNSLPLLGDILKELQVCEQLESLANQCLELNQDINNSVVSARAYSYLAEVAFARKEWKNVIELTEKARENQQVSLTRVYFIQGKAQAKLKLFRDAVNSLEIARSLCLKYLSSYGRDEYISVFDERKINEDLYLHILEDLQKLYFEHLKEYLTAFEIKQSIVEAKQRFGQYAFIGANRIKDTFLLGKTSGLIAPEITASGRDEDVKKLVERIVRKDYKVIVIYGESGVGKSSLVSGGLVPALQGKIVSDGTILPIYLRVYSDWLMELEEKLLSSLFQNGEIGDQEMGEREAVILDILKQCQEQYRIVFIFDQFEEFFFEKTTTKEQREFFSFVGECLKILSLRVIFCLRKDYLYYLVDLPGMESISNDILSRNNLYNIGDFKPEETKGIIQRLTEQSQFKLDDDLIDQLVQDLTEDNKIRPIELQIVGSQLQEANITTLQRYQTARNKQELVEKYVYSVVQACGAENEEVGNLVLYLLTDDKGTRPFKTRKELLIELTENKAFTQTLTIEESQLDLVLKILVASGLVVLIPDKIGDRYQLLHDYLTSFIRNKQAPEFEALLVAYEQEKVQRQALENSLQQVQTDIDKRKRQIKVLSIITSIIVGVGLSTFVWTVRTVKEAQQTLQATKIKVQAVESKALWLDTPYTLDALLVALKAGHQLQTIPAHKTPVDPETEWKTKNSLRQAIEDVKEYQRLTGHQGRVYNISFSPDGKTIASGGADGTITLWDTVTGKERLTLKGHQGRVWGIGFSPDGKTLASGSFDRTIKLWDTETGKERLTLKKHQGRVRGISFSPDGKTIASGSADGTIKLWDTVTGKERLTLKGHQGGVGVRGISFSPDGKTLASGSSDGTIKLWDTVTEKERLTLKGHQGGVNSISFSPDGKTITSGSDDGTIKLWDTVTGKERLTLKGHQGWVNSISFSPDGKTLASGSSDHTIKLWDTVTGTERLTLKGHQGGVWGISFSPDGKTLASGSYDRTIKLWNPITRKERLTLTVHKDKGGVRSISFSPNGKTLASGSFFPDDNGSDNDTIKLWDTVTWRERLLPLTGNKRGFWGISFSPNGKTLAFGGDDDTIQLWNTETWKKTFTLLGHKGGVKGISFSPNSKTLASGSDDGTIKLWDTKTEKERLTLTGHKGRVYSISFSPDGKTIASGSDDGTIKLWDTETGKERLTLKGHQDGVWGISFSPDGKTIASGSDDGTIKLWDTKTGKERLTLTGHQGGVWGISFSPDGKTIASGSADGTIKLWDTETGKERLILRGYQGGVLSISFSPDGKTIASGSDNGTIIIWNFDLDKLMQQGCGKVRRYLEGHPEEDELRSICHQ